jgi:hypothetical protein
MRIRTAYISFCIALFYHVNAFAAKNVEIVRYPSLLVVEGFSQSAGISYNYAGHSTPSSNTSSSALSEMYGFKSVLDIFDPHLANIQLDASISYHQQFGLKTATSLDGTYSMALTAFDLEYYPMTFLSTRTETLVSNGYVPPYTLTTTVNRIHASLLNKLLPVSVDYGHGTSQTSGLVQDSRSTSDSWSLSANHVIPEISSTSLTGGFSVSRTFLPGSESDTFNTAVALQNDLALNKKRDYTLTTVLTGTDSKASNIPQRGYAISEGLNCVFGRALTGNLTLQHNYDSSIDFDGKSQSTQSDNLSAGLSHRLFNSLSTGLSGSIGQSSMLGGSVTNYSAATSVTYNKLLPAQSTLRLNVGVSEQYSEQNFSQSNFDGRDELHVVGPTQGESIKLDKAGKLISVSTVRSLNADGITYTVYAADVDYRVNFTLGTIEVIAGGTIAPGTNLLISYRVAVNPSISFTNSMVLTSANLSFLNGRYNVGADYATQNETRISGEANNQQLAHSTSLNIHAEARYLATQFGADYGVVDNIGQNASHFGAYWNTRTSYTDYDTISFNLLDVFFMYSSTTAASNSQSNSITASGSYQRVFFELLRTSFSASAADSRDNSGNVSDFVYFSGTLDASFYSSTIALTGSTTYRFGGRQVQRDDNLSLQFTRYF